MYNYMKKQGTEWCVKKGKDSTCGLVYACVSVLCVVYTYTCMCIYDVSGRRHETLVALDASRKHG